MVHVLYCQASSANVLRRLSVQSRQAFSVFFRSSRGGAPPPTAVRSAFGCLPIFSRKPSLFMIRSMSFSARSLVPMSAGCSLPSVLTSCCTFANDFVTTADPCRDDGLRPIRVLTHCPSMRCCPLQLSQLVHRQSLAPLIACQFRYWYL